MIFISAGHHEKAQDIYFSISVNKLTEWLIDIKQETLVSENKKIKTKFSTFTYEDKEKTTIITGPNIYIDYQEGAKVYIDDE